MLSNMTIVAMITPTIATDTLAISTTRRIGISADRRSAIAVSARSFRKHRDALPSAELVAGVFVGVVVESGDPRGTGRRRPRPRPQPQPGAESNTPRKILFYR